MAGPLPILAADDPTVKIVVGVIVAIFWIGSQIFGALTKKPDRGLPPSNRRPPRMQPPVRPDGVRMPPPRQPPVRMNQQKPPPIRTQRRPTAATPQPTLQAARRQPSVAEKANTTTAPKPMQRNDMLRALLKTRNLKKGYVLTEILRPPVSMREPDGRSG